MHELILKDGSRLFGRIERETDQEVVFRTQSGATITAPRQEIVSLKLVKGRVERGEFVRTDMHRSRLFFAPTGRSLEKGQVSVGVFEFMAPFVQVGVTDRLLGRWRHAACLRDRGLRPAVLGHTEVPDPQTEKVQAAVGVLHVFDTSEGDSAGIAYGVGTFGSSDNAITAGAGMAYSGDSRGGIVMIGGERRVHRNIKLITENYIWQGGDGIVSAGVRFMGERLSADLGLAMPIGADEGFVFPVVSFVYVF